jgi:hypothetical protein
MSMRIKALAFLSLFLFAAQPSEAAAIRYPATGVPAVTFDLPSGWIAQPDEYHNLLLASADHSTVITLSMIDYAGSTDDLAKAVLQVAKADPPTGKTAVSVAGRNGFAYRSHAVQNDGKTRVSLRPIFVQVDSGHAFICTVMSQTDGDNPGYLAGKRLVDAFKLVLK